MEPEIKVLAEKKLVGLRMKMSLSVNKTEELWRRFMPSRNKIKHQIGTKMFSVQVFDPFYFSQFSPDLVFEKWAALEVAQTDAFPQGMETLELPSGMYAVFHYKGLSTDTRIFQYIYSTWLPASEYELDHRPNFEILGEKYRNNDPDSEEEIWIPIRLK